MYKYLIAGSLLGLIGYGIDVETAKLISCKAVITQYVRADFSSEYVCPTADGKSVTTCDKHYDKLASSRVRTVTMDGIGEGPHFDKGYYYQDTPRIKFDFTADPNFDGYVSVKDELFIARFADGSTTRVFNYLQCLTDTGKEIEYRTWYGIKLWKTSSFF
jgi:hypothetical protein